MDTYEQDKKAIEEYAKKNSDTYVVCEYLVRGAELVCSCGSNKRKLNLNQCHGIYVRGHAVVHEKDCIQGEKENITWFGVCTQDGLDTERITLIGDDGNEHSGRKCKPQIVGNTWNNAYKETQITDSGEDAQECNAVTTESYLVCQHGGLIYPINSGQERGIEVSEFVEGQIAYERVMGNEWNDGR